MDFDEARARLEDERVRVEGLIAAKRGEVEAEEESQDSEVAAFSPGDNASDTLEKEQDLSILDGLESELTEIEAAIERIEQGTYGIDEVTGAPIDPARLEALPHARTNVDSAPG
jgi:RNA polymerase-binding transcription factor DksA